ncbi:MAG: hypothetical protein JSV91_13360 [Phycisphaerales bacterium]|nr:MAG: hypothetical protein JSV91_13360 [Phycisphaerales bacterium]
MAANEEVKSGKDAGRLSRRKLIIFRLMALLIAFVLIVVVLECAARIYVYSVVRRGHLYRTDSRLGYSLLPDLSIRRRRSDGGLYTITTDSNGYRIASSEEGRQSDVWVPDASRKVLILGDSFAEALVNVEDRLDRVMTEKSPDWCVRMFGCAGWGPDQELLFGERFFGDLNRGDFLVLLTCDNDFADLLRHHHSGRAKPYFTRQGDELIEHPPEIGMREWLREKSYLAAFVILKTNPTRRDFSDEEIAESKELFIELIRSRTRPLSEKGVTIVVAHHIDWKVEGIEEVFARLEEFESIHCLAMDEQIGRHTPDNLNLLPCGHWNETGNETVADVLLSFLMELAGD